MKKKRFLSFIKFLKKNNAYGKYAFNLKSESSLTYRRVHGAALLPELFIYRMINDCPIELFNLAFMWSATTEGYDFWAKLHHSWLEYYRKNYER